MAVEPSPLVMHATHVGDYAYQEFSAPWLWYLCQRCETLACAHVIQTECASCRYAGGWGWPIQGQVSGS